MTRYLHAALAAAVACLVAGCELNRTSLLRLPRAEATHLRRYAEHVAGRPVLVIAHKAGACDVYPHNPIRGVPPAPVPAADLLADPELAPFDGVELDVHAMDGVVYVAHDALDLKKLEEALARQGEGAGEPFLRKSELAEAVLAYLGKYPDRQMFIELKVKHPEVEQESEALAKAVVAQLQVVRQRRPELDLRRLTFTSFTPRALQAFHGEAGAVDPGFGYALILGTNNPLYLLFSDLPAVEGQLKELEKPESRFITGVWFSLAGLLRPAEVLQRARDAGAREFVADAYLEEQRVLEKGMKRLSAQGVLMTGLVFDTVAHRGNENGNRCPYP